MHLTYLLPRKICFPCSRKLRTAVNTGHHPLLLRLPWSHLLDFYCNQISPRNFSFPHSSCSLAPSPHYQTSFLFFVLDSYVRGIELQSSFESSDIVLLGDSWYLLVLFPLPVSTSLLQRFTSSVDFACFQNDSPRTLPFYSTFIDRYRVSFLPLTSTVIINSARSTSRK